MAIFTGTATTFSGSPGIVGQREDLTDVIYNISPTETPFVSRVGRTKAEATFHEWQTDSLAAAAANAQLQGDDIASTTAVVPGARLGNRTQIMRKTVTVDGTLEAVRKAGRKSELAYQVAKLGKELKRDLEYNMVGLNLAKVTGDGTTAPKFATVLSWIKTNTNADAGGSDPSAADGTGTRSDSSTTRAFTEAQLKGVLKSIFDNSGDEPEMLLLPSAQKQVFSGFTGNATRMKEADNRLVASIDVYEYDFGTIEVVPDRFMRSRDALVINTDLWAVAWLRAIKIVDLARTGDAMKKMIIGEMTLEARNEKGSGGVFDLA